MQVVESTIHGQPIQAEDLVVGAEIAKHCIQNYASSRDHLPGAAHPGGGLGGKGGDRKQLYLKLCK
jgi:hypothetical protein